jgi:hypothetical protein
VRENRFSPQQEKGDLQMKDINHNRLGSTLDDLLESEGELTEITALAHKRVLAWQITERTSIPISQ